MEKPLWVDVIIPCYNQGGFLGEAIESVLGQTYPQVGVIVVNDGSTDETATVAQRYGERVRYIGKANAGLAAARNTGLLEARGEMVLFLDADDYLEADVVERHMAAVRATPSGAVFHGGWREIDAAGRVIFETGPLPLDNDPFHKSLERLCPAIHTITVRRSAFANTGIFDVLLSGHEDWDMWLRLAAAGYQFVAVPGSVSVYRRHTGSMSLTASSNRVLAGSFVLKRSLAYHTNCEICRRLEGPETRLWRKAYFELLAYELLVRTAHEQMWIRMGKAGGATLRNPFLARPLVDAFAGHLRRMVKTKSVLSSWTCKKDNERFSSLIHAQCVGPAAQDDVL